MKWFYNLKISVKLIVSFLILSAITAFVGIQGLTDMGAINKMLSSLYHNETRGIAYIKESNSDLLAYSRSLNNYLLSTSQTERDNCLANMKNYEKLLFQNIDAATPLIKSDEGKALIAQVEQQWNDYKIEVNQVIALGNFDSLAEKQKSITLLNTTVREKSNAIDTLFSELARQKEKDGKEFYMQSSQDYADTRLYLIILIIGSIGFGLGLGLYISKIISKPINKTALMIQEIGKGHLSERLNINTKDETGIMAAAIDSFADDLQKNVIGGMKRISEGDFNFEIVPKDSKDEISPALNNTTKTLKELKAETDSMTQWAADGQLEKKGNADKFQGGYKTIIEGFNNTINEIVVMVKQVEKTMETLSTGDLTARIEGEYKGNYKRLQSYVNNLGESLANIIREVSEAVSATASASTQISSSSEEMAAGAQEQSSQAQEVAAAVEQMTKTILETTKNAGNTADEAKNAGQIAKDGGKVISETIDGMNRIAVVVTKAAETVQELGKSSDQIGEIVQVIDDIADQTNLLALNAAIEAARAGEQGRGFAVVADEVRKLAERTTKATKEIADMIKRIQKDTNGAVESIQQGTSEVQKGKSLASKAGESLEQIITGSAAVVDSATQVAAASEEQSATAEQISKNIEAINNVTQESAAGVQQIARAAEDLNRLTDNLQNLVSKFNIDSERRNDRSTLAVRSNGHIVHAN
jgi:methyl-accepting chemotaxis protein